MTTQRGLDRRRPGRIAIMALVAIWIILSIVAPGPVAVHWDETGTAAGTGVPTWLVALVVAAVMAATIWVFRGDRATGRGAEGSPPQARTAVLVAANVFAILLVIWSSIAATPPGLGSLTVILLGSAGSYVVARCVVERAHHRQSARAADTDAPVTGRGRPPRLGGAPRS